MKNGNQFITIDKTYSQYRHNSNVAGFIYLKLEITNFAE